MKPNKIYISKNEIVHARLFDDDVEYIRKDALLKWLEQVKSNPMIPMNIDKVIEHMNSL